MEQLPAVSLRTEAATFFYARLFALVIFGWFCSQADTCGGSGSQHGAHARLSGMILPSINPPGTWAPHCCSIVREYPPPGAFQHKVLERSLLLSPELSRLAISWPFSWPPRAPPLLSARRYC